MKSHVRCCEAPRNGGDGPGLVSRLRSVVPSRQTHPELLVEAKQILRNKLVQLRLDRLPHQLSDGPFKKFGRFVSSFSDF